MRLCCFKYNDVYMMGLGRNSHLISLVETFLTYLGMYIFVTWTSSFYSGGTDNVCGR